MSLKTGYFPCSASPLSSGEGEEPREEPGRLSGCSSPRVPKGNGGNRRVKGERAQGFRSLLKVKFPKYSSHVEARKATNKDEPPARWILEPATPTGKNPEEPTKSGGSDSVGGDEFFFSQRAPSNTTNEKAKARHAVLMTISRMLEENQLIRQRLASLSQAN